MSDLIIYNTDDGKANVALLVMENEAWLTQNQLAELYDTSVPNITTHIKNILKDKELDENSVIKDYLITAQDGKEYQVKHYSLDMILAVGFRVRSPRGVQFRRWANTQLRNYLEKGFLVDKERLKNPQGRLDYFDEFSAILRNLKDDADKSIQKSVANNLNDLYKEAPEKFESIIQDWQKEELSSSCAWIIKHASRTKIKQKNKLC